MTGRSRTPPQSSEAGQAARATREARLAEALRDNLRKRKVQIRGRARDRAAEDPRSSKGNESDGGEA